MAEPGNGGGSRLLVRGVVVAVIVLAMLMLGVHTMVDRMRTREIASEHERELVEDQPPPTTATGPTPTTTTATAPTTTTTTTTTTTSDELTLTQRPSAPAPSTVTAGGGGVVVAPPSTTAAADPAVHRGTLDAMQVRGVVREALPEIRFCFEWQLQAHPDLAGRVTMQFTIQPDGTVTNASVLEDALHDDTVTNCFSHVMAHLRFPPPEGGSVEVHYPFHLDGAPEARRPEGI